MSDSVLILRETEGEVNYVMQQERKIRCINYANHANKEAEVCIKKTDWEEFETGTSRSENAQKEREILVGNVEMKKQEKKRLENALQTYYI